MARAVRNAKLDTRSARTRLPPKKAGYWAPLSRGCAIGYRKGRKGGVWLARIITNGLRREATLGPADDHLDADGGNILSFVQAQELAREWLIQQAGASADGPVPASTVADAIRDYLDWFRATGRKSLRETEYTVEAFILPTLGRLEVAALTAARLRCWLAEMAASPPRLRTRQGDAQQFKDTANNPEAQRRRQASANRILTVLKAALNHAWKEGKVASDDPWRRVQPFRQANAARLHYLDRAACTRLVQGCDPEFRLMVQAALLTGARYAELAALRVADFHRDTGTVFVRASKSGKSRHIELTDEGLRFFSPVGAGRKESEFLFARATGSPWGKSHQHRPLALACERAGIRPAVSFHILRHTYASLMIMDGVAALVVARNLGHGDTRMVERHYGHLSRSYVRDAIRSAASLGILEAALVED